VHDLTHYAVEAELRAQRGFWGLLAEGRTFADLRADPAGAADTEIAGIERIVGPMSSVVLGRLAPDRLSHLQLWPSAELVARILARMRELLGRWRAVRYREALVLEWPAAD